jgi:hypothetical protein
MAVAATTAATSLPGVTVHGCAVHQSVKSVVRAIRSLRSVGAGGGQRPPATRWGNSSLPSTRFGQVSDSRFKTWPHFFRRLPIATRRHRQDVSTRTYTNDQTLPPQEDDPKRELTAVAERRRPVTGSKDLCWPHRRGCGGTLVALRVQGAQTARMTKVEMFAATRRDTRLEGTGVRALARRYGIHRRTVREALQRPDRSGAVLCPGQRG